MAALLFKLRGVPEDEARDIRQLLSENDIEYYETSAGNWGISLPAIWVRHSDDLERGRALIDNYQEKRALHARQVYEEDIRREGEKTFLHALKKQPLRILLYIAVILTVLYLSTMPFVSLTAD